VAWSILIGVAVVDPKGGPDDGVVTRGSFSGDLADSELWVLADRFMRIFVYKSWLAMEFGDAEKGEKWGERLLKAKSLSLAEAERSRDDFVYRR
jgi:hypothetical protein